LENEIQFSIIHPSRSRANWAFQSAQDLINKSSTDLEYIVSVDTTDPQLRNYEQMFAKLEYKKCKIIIHKNDSKNCVESLNSGAKISTGKVLIYMSDDFLFPPRWDQLLIGEIQKRTEMKDDFVIWVYDNIQKRIMTICILSRKYYQRFGYIYNPLYESMYADNEYTDVAILLNKVIDARHLTFKHEHFSVMRKKPDAIYQIQNDPARYSKGKEIYEERKKINFGLKI